MKCGEKMNPVILVVGARPNFMKIAPIQKELDRRGIPNILLHTGQHYDDNMSKVFFDDLKMLARQMSETSSRQCPPHFYVYHGHGHMMNHSALECYSCDSYEMDV